MEYDLISYFPCWRCIGAVLYSFLNFSFSEMYSCGCKLADWTSLLCWPMKHSLCVSEVIFSLYSDCGFWLYLVFLCHISKQRLVQKSALYMLCWIPDVWRGFKLNLSLHFGWTISHKEIWLNVDKNQFDSYSEYPEIFLYSKQFYHT